MQLPVPEILVALTMFLISAVVTTPIAWLMYKYIERPGVALAGAWPRFSSRSGCRCARSGGPRQPARMTAIDPF